MSLLTRKAPHTVLVQLREMKRNAEGVRLLTDVGEPVAVRGMGEPVRDWSSSEEQTSGGLQVLDLIIWRSKLWPGDVNSLVEYDGDTYEVVGAPQRHHAGRRTQHHRVTLRHLRNGGL